MTGHDRIGTFQELVDLKAVQQLQEDFSAAVGLATYILDSDGQVLNRSGWSDLCAKFHHRSSVGVARCRENHRDIFAEVAQKRGVVLRICANGLAIAAAPILVAQRQIAVLVVSQVFLTPPDENRFRAQAQELDLEVEPYLAAVRQIRVLPEGKFLQMACLVGSATGLVSDLGQQNWKQKLLNEQLQREKAHLELSSTRSWWKSSCSC